METSERNGAWGFYMTREEKEAEIRRLVAEDLSELNDVLIDVIYGILRGE